MRHIMPAPQKTILVVDDEKALSLGVTRALQKDGFQVFAASTIAEAYETLQRETIDLCITDLALPDESGLTLLKKIRSEERFRSLPVIVQSGFILKEKVAEDVRALHPFRMFQKPVPLNDLVKAVRAGLGLTPTNKKSDQT